MVMLVLGVLLAFAVPSFSAMLERNRSLAAFHQLTASMAGARLAAVRTGEPVTLCPTREGLRCRRDLVWDDGWMSFRDSQRGEHPARASDVIEHVPLARSQITVRSTRGRHRLRFQPTGWASGANLSLRICTRTQARLLGAVVVNNAGRPRSERQAAGPASCPYVP